MHTPNPHQQPAILLLGAFPPQAQGIPSYCGGLANALADTGPVLAIGFKAMYPRWLFPGVKESLDPTSPPLQAANLHLRHALTWYNPLGWLWQALRAPVDIVHIQWWSLPLFPICLTFALTARLRRIPVVITVHNVLPHEPSPWFLRASRVLYRLADHLIVHSESNRAQLQEHFDCPSERVNVIPMGIGEAAPLPGAAEARNRLGSPPEAAVLLFFGTIRPYKGLRDLLLALAIVRKRHPEVRLIIAGKPWEPWEPYQAIIETENLGGHVHLALDYIPEAEIPHYLAAADLAVLPYTHFDAQSAAGTQLLAAGLPLLVTETGSLPDLVHHDPRWIAPPRNPKALAEKLEALLHDPKAAKQAFTTIAAQTREKMSWKTSAETHWEIYRNTMGGQPAGSKAP